MKLPLPSMYRYPRVVSVTSDAPTYETLRAWLGGLSGRRVAEELLAVVHGRGATVQDEARAMAAYVEQGLSFFDDARRSRTETAFVPMYYGMLNLSKAMVVASGRMAALNNARLHGATWSGAKLNKQTLLTDTVTLMPSGALPLLFEALTGSMWPKSANKRKAGAANHVRELQMKDVYPLIAGIGSELDEAFGLRDVFHTVRASTIPAGGNSEYLHLSLDPPLGTHSTRHVGILAGLAAESGSAGGAFISPELLLGAGAAPGTEARRLLRHHLLYCQRLHPTLDGQHGKQSIAVFASRTPRTSSNMKMPEEFPLILAAFHLSNVARYDPERMARLLDDRSRVVLASLHLNGAQRFMHLTWEYLKQTHYMIAS